MWMSFTYNAYKAMLEMLMNAGYRLTSFANQEDTAPVQAIIRHDVDISPVKALGMARCEEDLGVTSTYFFMVGSDWYNLMTEENQEVLYEIKEMGHEIGLHFDCGKYHIRNDIGLERHVLRELNVLGSILGAPVKSISWHIPSESSVDRRLDFLEDRWINNAYDPKFFSKYKYLSDSNMRWREDPIECIDPNRFPKLQILTHPFWYEFDERTKREILNGELGRKTISNIRYLEVISPGYVQIQPNHV